MKTDACRCIAHQFAHLSGAVAAASDIREARRLVIQHGARLLGTPWIALTHVSETDGLGFVAVSDTALRGVAGTEQRLGEGPACQVQSDGEVIVVDDLDAEHRWPGYCRELIAETPIKSVIGLPLDAGRERLGALMAYARVPHYFTQERLHHALLLRTHAATALSSVGNRCKVGNLEVALRTNREIGTAIGIVMDRLRLTDEQAFDHLRQVSQRTHAKLVDIAARVVLTGEVPQPNAGLPTSADI